MLINLGASAPSIAYTTNWNGKGPAWINPLFEDAAEFGYGLLLGSKQIRSKIAELMKQAIESPIPQNIKNAFIDWLDNMDDGEGSKQATEKILELLDGYDYQNNPLIQEIMKRERSFNQKILLGYRRRWLGI